MARIITLNNLTYTTDSIHSEQIKTFAGKNYGLIGKLLSDYLLLADSAEILEEYEAARADLLNKITEKCSLTERLTMNYALITTTSQILNRLGVLTNTDVIKQMCVILHSEVASSANPGKNLVIKIFNYICSNYKRLDAVQNKINGLEKANSNLMTYLEKGKATDSILAAIDKNDKEIKQLKMQLESKNNEISEIDDKIYECLVKKFNNYMCTVRSPESAALKAALIDNIQIGKENITVSFKPGVTIDENTEEYFNAG